MLETIMQSFSFIPYAASADLIVEYFFRKFYLLVAVVIKQIKRL